LTILQGSNIIQTESVKEAMLSVDRSLFSPHHPYQDSPQSIGHNATISAPHMHAYALEALSKYLHSGANVLDVGSGSGYLTACFSMMVGPNGHVTGIDHIQDLVDDSRVNINNWDPRKFNCGKIELETADGREGYAKNAPYDAIHVGAAADKVSEKLIEQLKPGGRMIIPVGPDGGTQFLTQIDKDMVGRIHSKQLMGVMYVPLTDRSKQIEKNYF